MVRNYDVQRKDLAPEAATPGERNDFCLAWLARTAFCPFGRTARADPCGDRPTPPSSLTLFSSTYPSRFNGERAASLILKHAQRPRKFGRLPALMDGCAEASSVPLRRNRECCGLPRCPAPVAGPAAEIERAVPFQLRAGRRLYRGLSLTHANARLITLGAAPACRLRCALSRQASRSEA